MEKAGSLANEASGFDNSVTGKNLSEMSNVL